MQKSFRVGDWVVSPELDRISRNANSTSLRPQVMEILVYLARHPGRVVSAEELLDSLWQGKVVTSGTFYNCVAELRQALADGRDQPVFVETIPKKGYRLVAPVTGISDDTPLLRRKDTRFRASSAGLVAVLALMLGILWIARQADHAGNSSNAVDPKAIAILPFSKTGSAGPDSEFLAFGIHDDLLTSLSRFADLTVISRSSVAQIDSSRNDTRAIGAELGVSKILYGSVQESGTDIRINVRLVEAASGKQLWTANYEPEISTTRIFAVQSDIVRNITGELKTVLSAQEKDKLIMAPTSNFDAYEAYQLGQLRQEELTVSSIERAIEYFQKAIDLDPNYAAAYVGLADSYMLQSEFRNLSPLDATRQMEPLLNTALRLDPDLGEAYVSFGNAKLLVDSFDPAAEAAYRKALELSPNNIRAHHMYGQFLRLNDRYEESLVQHEYVVRLAPLGVIGYVGLGQLLGILGRDDEAAQRLNKAIEIEPDSTVAMQQLYYLYELNFGALDQAVAYCWRAMEVDPDSADHAERLAYLYWSLGDPGQALEWAERAARLNPGLRSTPLVIQDDRAEILRKIEQQMDGAPAPDLPEDLLLHPWNNARYLMRANRFDDARRILEHSEATWFSDSPPAISWLNDYDATTLALILLRTGDQEKAMNLFRAILAWQKSALRKGIHGYGFADVMIHAVLGNKQEALGALNDAYKSGYRADYWSFRSNSQPWFELIRDDPEFLRITAAIEADLAAQLQRVRGMDIPAAISSLL